jgi:hypothetical protein
MAGIVIRRASACLLCRAPYSSSLPSPVDEFCLRCYRDLVTGLRRRRDAALRLCPLDDGTRDPLTKANREGGTTDVRAA